MFRRLHLLPSHFIGAACLLLACTASAHAGPGMFSVEARGDSVGAAEFETSGFPGQELSFTKIDVEATVNVPLSCCNGLRFSAGYEMAEVDWPANPAFAETDFNYISVGAGAFTHCLPCWRWVAMGYVLVDPENTDTDFNLYRGLLWGQYASESACFCEMNFHFGLLGSTGLEKSFVLPILGFDFVPWDRVKVSLVFPMDMSVSYCVMDNLSIRAALRAWRHRHRVSDTETIPKGVWEYRNYGYEVGGVYDNCCWLKAEAHVGFATGGDLQVTDRNGRNGIHYKTEGSMYAGGSVTLSY